ncbi:luciferin sulfotransferase [Nasonia vitripennis]|uniref:Sulfotransferase domain-containing protein n=1 Tax=Nasonia vitripennis TaxID=7425 RepID=A0A7M7QGB8_NASVI|nr:luciferin sulfotransferase [Nasonia vitripennis]XP_031787274.1 luciferin sulfotransferase [Nasonia vitripennis]XP_032456526.1 luciferin sulfotransferase [Nasonia vitripennis]
MACDLDRLAKETLSEKMRTNYLEFDGVVLPEEYKLYADQVENFEVYDDDVYVCSFQKSGTTWTQEMVWLIANDLDFEKAKSPINARFPFLEFSGTIMTARAAMRDPNMEVPSWVTKSVDFCKTFPRPRFIKSHQPFNLLPRQIRTGEKKPKIIYVARNPKDVCISFYHHSKLLEGFCGTFDDFCKLFLGDKLVYAPYWNHVRGFWERKDQDNMLFLLFEDMKKDLPSVVRKTAQFLGKTLDDSQVQALCKHLSFESMKVNPALNRVTTIAWIRSLNLSKDDSEENEFIRNGNVGQWKATMSEEWIKKFDEWSAKNLASCKGLKF